MAVAEVAVVLVADALAAYVVGPHWSYMPLEDRRRVVDELVVELAAEDERLRRMVQVATGRALSIKLRYAGG
jgi:acyl-CoA reductase-like NAD-dependent aldehyde dehydrogenase